MYIQALHQMVTRWGMSERLGTISYSEREDPFAGITLAAGARAYSEQTAGIIHSMKPIERGRRTLPRNRRESIFSTCDTEKKRRKSSAPALG
jgi:hypothetical protein